MSRGHQPIRTCISCGIKGAKKDFIRLTMRPDGKLIVDRGGKEQGRGAYICVRQKCLINGIQHNRLRRAFKMKAHTTIKVKKP